MSRETRLMEPAASISDASLSRLAQGLIGSEVLRIAAEIRAIQATGKPICNLTVGDFDPAEFPLPPALLHGVERALAAGHTNYPPSNGVLELRQAVARFCRRELGLEYPVESVLIAGGARPIIYATYRAIVDPGEKAVYPVPSWNNNHYSYLAQAQGVPIEVTREHKFHPTPEQIARVLPEARLLALCTPSNPTGTTMEPEVLRAICLLVVEENARRATRGERPVFLMFDQVYWALAFDGGPITPNALVPEVTPYVILVDAISKSLAATGLRVGWALAAPAVTARMSDLLGHVGAWAPKAEQVATAQFLDDAAAFREFRAEMQRRLRVRLDALHRSFTRMRERELPVEAVEPEGTLYLSARVALLGKRALGRDIQSDDDLRRLLLEEAGLAVVPFQAFGLKREDGWFRLSVGAASLTAIEQGMERLEAMLVRATAGAG